MGQQMIQLQSSHPDVCRLFVNEHHVVRRTDKPFEGIYTDLSIEQVLMRSIKSSGGLTRGTGIGEDERLIWLMCMPAFAEIHKAMQDLTGVSQFSSEQHMEHVDQSLSRQNRDNKDIKIILQFLVSRNPFQMSELRSISSGRVASKEVIADIAETVGEGILGKIVGKM